MDLRKALGLAFLAGALSWFPVASLAACSTSKVYSLYKKGIDVEEIADQCEMDEDDVQAIIEKKSAQEKKRKPEGGTEPAIPRQAHCCDGFGNSRCPIVAGTTRLGASCFCPGQGYGVICR